jgi:hypothetical protein
MSTNTHFGRRNITGLSRVRTRGSIPFLLIALAFVTSCSTSDQTSAVDTTASIPVVTSAPSTSSSTTTSSTIARTAAELDAASAIGTQGEGYTSLFVGHSFFEPLSTRLPDHAVRAGLLKHSQVTVMAGGANGAPEALWNDPAMRTEILNHLSRGDIDLFGMTYHPDYPTLTGYRLWIEEALSHNPKTAFFVGMPWVWQPESLTAADYAVSSNRLFETVISPIVAELKTEFPGATFFAIPYGRAASVLYELFEAGQLPGIRAVVGDPQTSLFIDTLGHTSGTIIEELGVLVWLRAIYCVDLSDYSYPSRFTVDLAAIAMSIVAEQRADDTAPWCRTS